ncbi:MAG TPA: S8 family serine peptidase [Verrucomicrobiae bacterium]|nr:S8 family serine peptidase [Verrucomicrobiae bacterium]
MNTPLFQSSMETMKRVRRAACGLLLLGLCLAGMPGWAATTNTLSWNKATDRVSADVRDWELVGLLEEIAGQTGWNVFVEPDDSFKSSVKFKDLPSRQALRLLLGEMNFAIMPPTNGIQRLYVFRTTMKNANRPVWGSSVRRPAVAKRVPNELIVQVKPGTDIEELARRLGAKVVGHIPELNAYRLQFQDEEATQSARKLLAANPDVTSVQDNFYVDRPQSPQNLGMAAPETRLKLDPPKGEDCKVVVGFVDTALQALGPQLEPFVKERLTVTGEAAPVDSSLQPTHQTAMVNSFYQGMQASGQSSTSVKVLSVDVFGNSASANTFNVAAGMILAGNRGATVINASLGGYGDSPLLRDAVKQLAQNNIPVFAAVGNDGSNTPFFPAAYPEVISVTAVERGKVASYANVGTPPDAGAPGTVIFSYNGLTYGSRGTSVSSAAAAGIAAGMADRSCAPWSQVIPAVQKTLAVPAPQ